VEQVNINSIRESTLIQYAREARRPTRWWLAALFIVFIGIIGAQVAGEALFGLITTPAEGSIAAQIAEIVTNGIGLLLLWAWLKFKEVRAFSSVGLRGLGALQKFITGVAIGAGLITLSVLALLVVGQYGQVPVPAGGSGGVAALLPALLLVGVWVVQASTEEIFTRGYLLQAGGLQLPGWVAILVPALLFTGLHFVGAGLSAPVAILNIMLFSLLASFVALRQGSLWMVCGIHTGWNWFQGNVFGAAVSDTARTTSLFHFGPSETASYWVAGGGFGPENSLVVSVVWGIAAFIAYRYFTAGRPSSVDAQPAGAARV
jgi:membrane protease YdiL (CAAX protease family)